MYDRSGKSAFSLDRIIQKDASEHPLSNDETPSSIALTDRKLFKKWSRPFNSDMDYNFDINIISPSQQDKIGSENLLTPDGQTIDDAIDDEEETKS
ncbi:unnamed protein product [Rotaria sp. Silwood2]|nr:unnamed protein product [Rotaria sp. Silwood2]CAF4491516.1 unnamed protein product [Rotaria sp. Silwood2]